MFLLYIKAFHIISVIAWMAGVLYLPRLFVYHTEAEKGSRQSETFKIMERRLLKAIITPAMIASWVFGLVLAFQTVDWSQAGWFHLKLVLVVVLSASRGSWPGGPGNSRKTAILIRSASSDRERGSDAADRHRHSGGGEAL